MAKKTEDIEQKLLETIGALENQIAELTTDLKRVQADFVNFRRRSDEERSSFVDLAKQDVIGQILPVLDNIARALKFAPSSLKGDPWAMGLVQIAKQADETLTGMGVTKIDALGSAFDPNLHEAIGYVDGEGDHEVVVEEFQSGYTLNDKVLRHAMVKVGKAKQSSPISSKHKEGEENE
ncbi:MAG: nucleotide exchange factor GrpE [Candidatus Saccharimonadia bacterium]